MDVALALAPTWTAPPPSQTELLVHGAGREASERRTTLTATTSPVAFLTLRSLRRKYQKRDLATTSLGAKMRIR